MSDVMMYNLTSFTRTLNQSEMKARLRESNFKDTNSK